MRRSTITVHRPHRPFRLGTLLALAGLLLQLVLPGAMAFARTADPLGSAPICSTGPQHGSDRERKALHAACPLCQSQAVVWGFLPPDAAAVTGPRIATTVSWSAARLTATPAAPAGLRARGPPRAA